MITRERRKELASRYALGIKGQDRNGVRHQWFKHQTALFNEGDDHQIFIDLRSYPRKNGAKLDKQLLSKEITPKEFFYKLRTGCADVYASALNRYGLARIDITDPEYRKFTRDMALRTLQIFRNVDPDNETEVCIAMAKSWHLFVRRLHIKYGLPATSKFRDKMIPESDAEETVLAGDDFDIPITKRERDDWERIVA